MCGANFNKKGPRLGPPPNVAGGGSTGDGSVHIAGSGWARPGPVDVGPATRRSPSSPRPGSRVGPRRFPESQGLTADKQQWQGKTSGAVPFDWQTGVVVPIFKSGDQRVCSNYRGITLLSLPGKVYARVLEKRIRLIVEPLIEEEQCGFRPGHRTTDHLFTLAGVLEGSYEFAQPVHMCFVDLEKAYDQVPRSILISRRSRGVEGVEFGGQKISSLLFADDVVLLAPSNRDLQQMLGRFTTECEAAGMRISTSKSESMVLARKKVECLLWVGEEVLPQVEEFKYLGILFTSEGWPGLSLRDRVRSSDIREGLGVELLLLHIERDQLGWLWHLARMPSGRLSSEVLRTCPTGRRPCGRPRTRWRDYISRRAWDRLGVPPEELIEVAGERAVWASLLKLLPLRPGSGLAAENETKREIILWLKLKLSACPATVNNQRDENKPWLILMGPNISKCEMTQRPDSGLTDLML
ncbi:hypothetical protein D4764_12G0006360 [Takifugu flavidus]|uniref:Reverse transcriptase domain-containing protein n=1 Tax=Takifugu flavidus TaxID=433684 RepID=A0A5C6PDH2_9TELE|nr:hypothetical protein D4764_12G0006360 [Takifugu flavidus]